MDLRKTYNVVECAGFAANTINSMDVNLARGTAVQKWINENFADIFEAVVEKTGSEVYTNVYLKGTTSGIYIQQHTNTNYNYTGIVHNCVRQVILSGHHLFRNEVNLLVVKSKYGVICGFYKDTIGGAVRVLGIKTANGFLPILFNGDKMYVMSLNSERSINLPLRSTIGNAYLTRLAVPLNDLVCENVYWSMGVGADNCGIFRVKGNDAEFIELHSDVNYNGLAMKLEEPADDEFSDIKNLWIKPAEPAEEETENTEE